MQVSLRKGVTLIEAIIGSIILAITFAGLLATFVAVRKYVKRANKRLITIHLVSTHFNDLYRAVRQDTWNSGTLQPGSTNLGPYTIDDQVYEDGATPNNYKVTTVGDYRRVSVTINYP